MDEEGVESPFGEVMRLAPLSIPIILFAVFSGILVSLLKAYHIKLLATNKTTNEDLKSSYRKLISHPFDRMNWRLNMRRALCPPMIKTLWKPREKCISLKGEIS